MIILSTHIVDDVSDLCPRMAIIGQGRIIGQGIPAELIRRLERRIWTKPIAKDELEAYRGQFEIISTRLFAGRTIIHVLSETDPGDGFAPAVGGLEDFYFSTLAAARKAA